MLRDGVETRDPGRAARRRRPVRRPPRREGRHRRRRRRRARSAVDASHAHRRVRARRGRPRRRRRRRDRQRRRPPRRAGHPGRRRHPARADGPARRGRPDRQGRRCSGSPTGSRRVFVPVVIVLAVATLGFWLGAGAGRAGGVHRRGRRADHRLPVRARAGHADRPAGRHRPRRPARHPHQGPRGARVHPARRHRRARQDRHRHHRPDGLRRRASPPTARTPTRCCAWPARSRTPPSTRSPGRSPARRDAGRPAARRRGLRQPRRASASQGVVDGHAVVVGRPPPARRLGPCTLPTDLAGPRRTPRPAGAPPVAVGWDGAARGVARRRRHGQADLAPRRSRELRGARAARRSCSPATTQAAAARRRRARSASTDVIAEVLPADKVDVGQAPAGRGPGRRDGRRRRQRRRRARPGRPRPGHGHRHRRRHRGQRPHPRARRPAGRGRRHPALPAHAGHDQGQPVLGVRLQRRRAPAGRRRAAQPDDRRRRDGLLQRVRRDQQPAAARASGRRCADGRPQRPRGQRHPALPDGLCDRRDPRDDDRHRRRPGHRRHHRDLGDPGLLLRLPALDGAARAGGHRLRRGAQGRAGRATRSPSS